MKKGEPIYHPVRRSGVRFIAELPLTKRHAWRLSAYVTNGRTMVIATHPDHLPIVIDTTKAAEPPPLS
jgi:hypothetical protein